MTSTPSSTAGVGSREASDAAAARHAMAEASAITLHLPEEPVSRRIGWWEGVAGGRNFDDVLEADDGLGPWLWTRWRALEAAGMGEKELVALVAGYRREWWLWLIGDRRWGQACGGFIGRVQRRVTARQLSTPEPTAAEAAAAGAAAGTGRP